MMEKGISRNYREITETEMKYSLLVFGKVGREGPDSLCMSGSCTSHHVFHRQTGEDREGSLYRAVGG